MNERNISRFVAKMQLYTENEQVYCPMCEEMHANHTWCQLPGMTMEGY